MSTTESVRAPAALAVGAERREVAQEPTGEQQRARQRGVRRTLWIAATVAAAFFVLSILSMLKIG